MSTLARLGALIARHRWGVLAAAFVAVALALPFGADVESRLSQGGLSPPRSESAVADAILTRQFAAGPPNLVFVVTAQKRGTVDDARVADQGLRLTRELTAERGVEEAGSYWSLGRYARLRSSDGRSALVLVRLSGNEDAARKSAARIVPRTVGRGEGVSVRATGTTEVLREIDERSQEDLSRAELLAAPLILLVLLLVFRGLVAALLPLLVGAMAVVGTLAMLRVLNMYVPVSVFSVNITTALGIGLAVDYSLFMITRYREELATGAEVPAAVAETVRTAGRTVLFSAVTVSLSLSGMLLFPMFHLRSFAYAGIAVVLLAALGAVVLLPALLALLGHRVEGIGARRRRPSQRRGHPQRHGHRAAHARQPPADPRRAGADGSPRRGFWYGLATTVMRRPLLLSVPIVALLLTAGSPVMRLDLGLSGDQVLPTSSSAQQAAQLLRTRFGPGAGSPVTIVLPALKASSVRHDIDLYAARLALLPGVDHVDAATGTYRNGRRIAPAGPVSPRIANGDGTWLQVQSAAGPYSSQGAALVQSIRRVPAPGQAFVGGDAAQLVDIKTALRDRTPYALGVVALSTALLLFLFTGGVLLPLKALVLNTLSLSATFGALVYVFQEGHLRRLLGNFVVTGQIDFDLPVLMFCVAFGLSMDYEVFMLARIKEEYDRTGDNIAAAARGLQATGGLVTAAALLFAVVMAAFATSGLTPLKVLGTGMALAVLMDATLVRGVLVPAFMRLAGHANWWAPRPLARLHRFIGLTG